MCPIVTLDDGEVRDEIRQPLYDTVDLNNATNPTTLAGTYRFFSTLVYGPGMPNPQQPKSLAKTNMTLLGQNNQLAVATSFRTQGLCLDAQFNESTAAAVTDEDSHVLPIIVESGSIRFTVGVKDYWYGPARFACGRLQQFEATGVATVDRIHQQYGWSSIQPIVFRGHHVVDINSLQNFLVTLEINSNDLVGIDATTNPSAGQNFALVFSLKGLLRRPVQ